MTSSEREQLVWFLVEAEVEESRLTKIVDPNAVLGKEAVVVNPLQMAGRLAKRGSARVRAAVPDLSGARDFLIGAPNVRQSRSGHIMGRGVPGFKGTQAYGKAVTLARDASPKLQAAGKWIAAGARGEGIRGTLSPRTTIIPAAVGGTGASISHGRNWSGFGRAAGRSAAVYGGAAALTAGGALGARALYRRHKARKARKEQE